MQRLILLGMNHRTAPLELRERVVLSNSQRQREALCALRERFPDAEFALLSTCNRVEIYSARAVHGQPQAAQVQDFLGEFSSVDPGALRGHVYEKSERDAVEHLFAVASSLDSMVLGETQILGQVREAYELACSASATGAVLNPLFQRAIAVGKQVMSQTVLGDGRLSVAGVAVDYARRIFDHFNDKTVLCIGAGKITQLVLQSFAALAPGRLLICNRDGAKSAELAQKFGGQSVPFDSLDEQIVQADVVVSSTASSRPIIARSGFDPIMRRRRFRPIFMIDLAVPRDIEASIGTLDNVFLYNIDDLQDVVSKTQSLRSGAVDSARNLVAGHVEEFVRSQRARQMGPMIDALYKRSHAAAQEELARTIGKLPNVSDADRAQLEDLARRIVNKLLHDPMAALREGDSLRGPAMQYLHAVEKLFRLNDEDS